MIHVFFFIKDQSSLSIAISSSPDHRSSLSGGDSRGMSSSRNVETCFKWRGFMKMMWAFLACSTLPGGAILF